MAYCGPAGIAYEEWAGWSDFSRSAALAWKIRESARCGSCGTVPAEWKAIDWNGDPVIDSNGQQYLVRDLPFLLVEETCPCCKAIASADDMRADKKPQRGLMWAMKPNPAASPVDPPDKV